MKYKVFVASTYADLGQKRDYVIQRLRKADLEVVCMEDFAADGEHPAKLSEKRVRECHFCVALIAYKTGTVSTAHSSRKSITQIEIEAARKSGLMVLPFLLRETQENISAWPIEFNNLGNEEFRQWRANIAISTTAEFFDAHEQPDPLPAITRQISKHEHAKRRRLQISVVSVALLLVALISAPFASTGFRQATLAALHRYNDPVVFREPNSGDVKIARLLENRSEIQGAGFGNDIAAAKYSFVLLGNTFGSFRLLESEFEAAAKRGVKLRFILGSFADNNRSEWKNFIEAIDDSPKALDEIVSASSNIRSLIRNLKSKFPGNVDYRLHSKPLFYTMWVRDAGDADSLGHISVPYYGKSSQTNWPAYRVSQRTGGTQIDALSAQFELLWLKATTDPEK